MLAEIARFLQREPVAHTLVPTGAQVHWRLWDWATSVKLLANLLMAEFTLHPPNPRSSIVDQRRVPARAGGLLLRSVSFLTSKMCFCKLRDASSARVVLCPLRHARGVVQWARQADVATARHRKVLQNADLQHRDLESAGPPARVRIHPMAFHLRGGP